MGTADLLGIWGAIVATPLAVLRIVDFARSRGILRVTADLLSFQFRRRSKDGGSDRGRAV
jgi:hypothetical protein